MACRWPYLLLLLLGWLRAAGGFPFCWRWGCWGQLEVQRSVVATVWSWLMVATLATLSFSCVANSPEYRQGTTFNASSRILNYINYSTAALLFVYLILYRCRLALILQRMEGAGVPLRRRLMGWRDVVQVLCSAGMIICLVVATYSSVSDFFAVPITKDEILYHIPATTCDVAIEMTALSLSLLLYYLLKVLSLEGEAAVAAVASSSPATVCWGELTDVLPQPRTAAERILVGASQWVPQDEACRQASRRLLELDDIVAEVIGYGGPPAGMIILCSTVNATVMIYLTIAKYDYYYLAFITLKVLSVVQVAFIPDCLCCKKERNLRLVRRLRTTALHCSSVEAALKDVEKVLSSSVTFRVCRLFTLDRHILLSVASSVVTYLVIALQFGVSENPDHVHHVLTSNCSCLTE